MGLLINRLSLGASFSLYVQHIGIRGRLHYGYLDEGSKSESRLRRNIKLTPKPLIKRQTRFNTNPRVPLTYSKVNPESRMDGDTSKSDPRKASWSRSSGIHAPAWRRADFMSALSDRYPAIIEPTWKYRVRKIKSLFSFGRNEGIGPTNETEIAR